MYYLYIIQSTNKLWRYIGITEDVKKRLLAHNKGTTKSTKPYRPFILIYSEEHSNINEARKREIYLKKTARAREQLYDQYGAIV